MSNTKQQIEEMLNKVSEYNKLSGKGHGDLKDNCYICGISPSGLVEAIDRLVTEEKISELSNHKKLVESAYRKPPISHQPYLMTMQLYMGIVNERIFVLQSQLNKEEK